MSKYIKVKAILEQILEGSLKLPKEEVQKLLPEDENEFSEDSFKSTFLALDKLRIEAIGQRGKEQFDDGYKKGQKESLSKLEEAIKAKFDLEGSQLTGLELVENIVASKAGKAGKTKLEELSEDEVKTHPAVIKLMDARAKDFKEQLKAKETEFETFKNSVNTEKTFSTVHSKALEIFDSLNPILSTDAEKAKNQKSLFINLLKEFEYKIQDNQIVVMKEGKLLEDDHFTRVNFDDLVKQKASSLFDFKAADDRKVPPAGGPGGGGSAKYTGAMPKNESEYAKIITDKEIPVEQRKEVQEYWQKQQV